jgi:mannose-6-phosphate isomerase-like protein (cupin superfamily)
VTEQVRSAADATAMFSETILPLAHDILAPDGSEVRVLAALARGSMAHFTLRPGQVSRAVRHRTVEEIWYVVGGHGDIWRSLNGRSTVTDLSPGVCLTIPVGTDFQFRAATDETVSVVAVTMPPWPGQDEAIFVAGPWNGVQ